MRGPQACTADQSGFIQKHQALNTGPKKSGETHEYTEMYPGMAKTARDEGFEDVADW
jgi:rubrerythrin